MRVRAFNPRRSSEWGKKLPSGVETRQHSLGVIGTTQVVPLQNNEAEGVFQQTVKPCPFKTIPAKRGTAQ